jgi:hypothetical protein
MIKQILLLAILLNALTLLGQEKRKPEETPGLHGGIYSTATAGYSAIYRGFSRFNIGIHGNWGYADVRFAASGETDALPFFSTTRAGFGLKHKSVTALYGLGGYSRTDEVVRKTSFDFLRVSSTGTFLRFDITLDWQDNIQNIINYRGSASVPLGPRTRVEVWGDKPLGFGIGGIYTVLEKNTIASINLRLGALPTSGNGIFSNMSFSLGLLLKLDDTDRDKLPAWEIDGAPVRYVPLWRS